MGQCLAHRIVVFSRPGVDGDVTFDYGRSGSAGGQSRRQGREGPVVGDEKQTGSDSKRRIPVSPILVDSPDAKAVFDRDILSRMGHGILACHGPGGGTICPIIDGGHCDLVDGAHGVIFQLDLDEEEHRHILGRYVEELDPDIPLRVPDIPLRVKVRPGQAERYSDLDAFSSRVEAYERTSRPDEVTPDADHDRDAGAG